MAEYYLMSQLPSLDGIADNIPMPVTEERFIELCERFLGKKALEEIRSLTLSPKPDHEKSSSALIEAWNEGESDLRFALAKVRADKMKKPFNTENKPLSNELLRVANTAVEMESPLGAEKYLSEYRLAFFESLRPLDTFSLDFVFYYGLKLKLILRIRQFDAELGEAAYRNIYNSVLNGERLEAVE